MLKYIKLYIVSFEVNTIDNDKDDTMITFI